jgi:hypothetical protein
MDGRLSKVGDACRSTRRSGVENRLRRHIFPQGGPKKGDSEADVASVETFSWKRSRRLFPGEDPPSEGILRVTWRVSNLSLGREAEGFLQGGASREDSAADVASVETFSWKRNRTFSRRGLVI